MRLFSTILIFQTSTYVQDVEGSFKKVNREILKEINRRIIPHQLLFEFSLPLCKHRHKGHHIPAFCANNDLASWAAGSEYEAYLRLDKERYNAAFHGKTKGEDSHYYKKIEGEVQEIEDEEDGEEFYDDEDDEYTEFNEYDDPDKQLEITLTPDMKAWLARKRERVNERADVIYEQHRKEETVRCAK